MNSDRSEIALAWFWHFLETGGLLSIWSISVCVCMCVCVCVCRHVCIDTASWAFGLGQVTEAWIHTLGESYSWVGCRNTHTHTHTRTHTDTQTHRDIEREAWLSNIVYLCCLSSTMPFCVCVCLLDSVTVRYLIPFDMRMCVKCVRSLV